MCVSTIWSFRWRFGRRNTTVLLYCTPMSLFRKHHDLFGKKVCRKRHLSTHPPPPLNLGEKWLESLLSPGRHCMPVADFGEFFFLSTDVKQADATATTQEVHPNCALLSEKHSGLIRLLGAEIQERRSSWIRVRRQKRALACDLGEIRQTCAA